MVFRKAIPLVACLSVFFIGAAEAIQLRTLPLRHSISSKTRPDVHNCSEHYFEQKLDHFNFPQADSLWSQRYFVYDGFFHRHQRSKESKPVFFYAGNEADVETYVNFSGLLWELGEEIGALLVFAEHRYYGRSQPFGQDSLQKDPSFLSIEQALADFATLIYHVKDEYGASDSAVIAFGGSYGGMLAAWLRKLYPNAVQGAIAASAPVGAYVSVYNPTFNPSEFWEVVTYDASPAAGAAEHCRSNTRSFFELLLGNKGDEDLWEEVTDVFGLCKAPQGAEDVERIAYWVQGAYDAFAMGNYPYPSSYMGGDLPAWPMRAACQHLAEKDMSSSSLLKGMAGAVGLLYNASGDQPCYNATELVGPAGPDATWLFQWCTQRAGQELPYYPATGVADMFWDQGAYDEERIKAECMQLFNFSGSGDWPVISLGGFDFSAASNIVFSNGEYDPWRIGGITSDVSSSVVAVLIESGAHHLDLMFSHPDDPLSVVEARKFEKANIEKWLQQSASSGAQ